MQGASFSGGQAARLASASMSDSAAAAAAPSSSREARTDTEDTSAGPYERAKKRVGGTVAGNGGMAGGDVGAIDDAAEGEVDSAMEVILLGSTMENEAMEGAMDEQSEIAVDEEVCGIMGVETQEEKEVDDEMGDDADEGAADRMGNETEEDVANEAEGEAEERLRGMTSDLMEWGAGGMMADEMGEEEVDRETEDEVGEEGAGTTDAETVGEADEMGSAIGGRVEDEEEDDSNDEASSPAEAEDQVQEEPQEHGAGEFGHGNEPQASPRPEVNEAEQRPDLALNLGSHLLEFWGCVAGTHRHGDCGEDDDNRHENHRSLEAVNRITGRLPNVIGRPGFLGPDNALRARRLPRDWQLAFEGREGSGHAEEDNGARSAASDSENEGPREQLRISLCLSESELKQSPDTIVEFDVDSLLGFARSLAFARRGIMLDFVPQFYQNISSNVHLTLPVQVERPRGGFKTAQVMLHKIPHISFGRVLGQEDIGIYIFFPRQYDAHKATNFPGQRHGRKHRILQQWTDHVLLPAIQRHSSAGILQHLPSSWLGAQLAALARHNESLAREGSKHTRHQSRTYPLKPGTLDAIWQTVVELTHREGLGIFRDPIIFFASKNRKLAIKERTLSETWEAFDVQLRHYLDTAHLDHDKVFVDLGKETISSWTAADEDGSPAVFLYRPCCLDSFQREMSLGGPATQMRRNTYQTAMMRDAVDSTFEPKASSAKAIEGWIYSQFYGSHKELYDAAKTKPFHSAHLPKLTWDPKVFKMLEHVAGATTATRRQLEESFLKSKQRLANAVKEAFNKSYGVREEHRVSLTFLGRIKASLQSAGKWDQPATRPQGSDDTPYWQLATKDYISFVGQNANKFLLLFEWILTMSATKEVSYEHCKVLTMLLQAIRDSFDSVAQERHRGLYEDSWTRRRGGQVVHGMGLRRTMSACGYGWLSSKIDWDTLEFVPKLRDQMVFNDTMLRDTYRRRGLAVRSAKNDLQFIEQAGQWLRLYCASPTITAKILSLLVMVVVQHFRKEVFHNLKDKIRDEHRQKALSGQLPLCPAVLEEVLERASDFHVCSASMTKIKTVRTLVDVLWDSDDGYARKRWANRSYRHLHQVALKLVERYVGVKQASGFHDVVKRMFVVQTWAVPCVNHDQFWRRNGSGEQLWLALSHRSYERRIRRRNLAVGWMGLPIYACNGMIRDGPKRCEWMEPWRLVSHGQNLMVFNDTMMGGMPQELPKPDGLEVDFSQLDSAAVGQQLEDSWMEEEEQALGRARPII